MVDGIPFSLLQLLCARISHDLAGPAAALATGLECAEAGIGDDPETLQLLLRSGRQLNGRLAFFRAAFGPASGPLAWAQLRKLCDGLVSGEAVTVEWEPGAGKASAPLPAEGARLLLLLVLIAASLLQRGGRIRISAADDAADCMVRLEGAGLSADSPYLSGLSGQRHEALSARSAPSHLCRLVALSLGRDIRFSLDGADRATLSSRPPVSG